MSKRKRRAQGELFKNNLQKIWISRASGTSCSVRILCDPRFVVFFKPFLKAPVYLHRGFLDSRRFVIQVKPKTWALAFLQWDMKEASAILSENVFTQEELLARNAASDDTAKLECLNAIKREAVARAVVWMGNKNQDPWAYDPSTNINISDAEWFEINCGFLKFTKVVHEPLLFSEAFEEGSGMPPGVFKDPQENNENLYEQLTDKVDSILSLQSQDGDSTLSLSNDEIYETIWGLVVVERRPMVILRLIDLQQLRTPTQTVKQLSLTMIDDLNEVFVDAVQFDRTQFSILERRRNSGFPQMVRSLFRMLYRRYNENSTTADPQNENSTFLNFREDEQAPVLLLSIIRILKWLSQFEDKFDEKAREFDATQHNVFPDKQQMQEVFRVLREVCPGRFDDEDAGDLKSSEGNGKTLEFLHFEPSHPIPASEQLQHQHEEPCHSRTLVGGHHQYSVPSPMQISSPANCFLESKPHQTTLPMIDNSNATSSELGTCINQSGFMSLETLGSTYQLPESYTVVQSAGISGQEITQETLNDTSLQQLLDQVFVPKAEHAEHGYEMLNNDTRFTYMTHQTSTALPLPSASNATSQYTTGTSSSFQIPGVNGSNQGLQVYQLPNVLVNQPSAESTNGHTMMQLKYNMSFNGDGTYLVNSVTLTKYPDYSFNVGDLNKAYQAMQGAVDRRGSLKSNPSFEAGKELFRRMFTQDEIDTSNINGRRTCNMERRGFFKDPELKDRSNALLDMLPVLSALVEQRRSSVVPAELPLDNVYNIQVEKNDLSRNELKREIFTEYRYQLSTKQPVQPSDN